MFHISKIEKETNLKITGLVNNTHLLWETRPEDILKGYFLCKQLSEELNVPLKYNCCIEELVEDLNTKTKEIRDFKVFPMRLLMRDGWMNR